MGDSLGVVAATAEGEDQLGEARAAASVILAGSKVGRSSSGAAKTARRIARASDGSGAARSSRVTTFVTGEAGEVGPDFDCLEVGDDEEGRVLQRVAVTLELEVGGLEVLALALVLPGEEAALPDVGEAVAAAQLLRALLERVPGAVGVGVGGGGLAQDAAQVDEVGLRRRALGGGDAAPLRGELAGRHGADDTGR